MPEQTSIMLRSNSICYGPCPKPSDDVKQRLSIHSNGRVWLMRYIYGTGEKYKINQHEQFQIVPDAAQEIMKAIDAAFSVYEPLLVCDVGTWELSERAGI